MVFRRLMMILKVIDASSQGQFALLHIKYAIEVVHIGNWNTPQIEKVLELNFRFLLSEDFFY